MQNNNPLPVPGHIIRKLRQLKGTKQKAVCKSLGFSQQAYSKLECCNTIPAHKIPVILNALGSNEAELQAIIRFTPPSKK